MPEFKDIVDASIDNTFRIWRYEGCMLIVIFRLTCLSTNILHPVFGGSEAAGFSICEFDYINS